MSVHQKTAGAGELDDVSGDFRGNWWQHCKRLGQQLVPGGEIAGLRRGGDLGDAKADKSEGGRVVPCSNARP